jgi:hypothetical protein
MLTCDAALLAFVLLTKPWKNLAPPGLSTPLMLLGIAVSIALPWIVVRPGQATLQPGTNGTTTVDPVKGTPSGGRVYINMSPEKWLEKSIYDVEEFTRVVPIEKIPSDGRIILWRQHCDHCAKHLREMAAETATTPILLVQVMDDLNASRAVDLMPTGDHVTSVQLPPGEGMFTTPVEIRVEGGVVKSALLADDLEKAHQ